MPSEVLSQSTPPGLMDGPARILVRNGKPLSAEGRALLDYYNAHPPVESEKPVGTFATVMAERRARGALRESGCAA